MNGTCAGFRDYRDSQNSILCNSAGGRTGRQSDDGWSTGRVGVGVIGNDRDVGIGGRRRGVVVGNGDGIKAGTVRKREQIGKNNVQAARSRNICVFFLGYSNYETGLTAMQNNP